MSSSRVFSSSLIRALPRGVGACTQASALRISPIAHQRAAAVAGLHSSASRLGVSTRFTQEHEWVKFDDSTNIGVVGITDYAQDSLGDVVFVEVTAVGKEVGKGKEIGAVESVKAASDIYAPVSGTVEEVNSRLEDEPGLVNKSPEADGWLCTIKLSTPSEFETLLSEEAYKKFTEEL